LPAFPEAEAAAPDPAAALRREAVLLPGLRIAQSLPADPEAAGARRIPASDPALQKALNLLGEAAELAARLPEVVLLDRSFDKWESSESV